MLDLSLIASKISNGRREKGFTQEELALRLGVSTQAVSKWERGLSLPDIELLLDLSKILDITINHLLDTVEMGQGSEIQGKSVYDLSQMDMLETVDFDPILITIGCGLYATFSEEFLKEITQLRRHYLVKHGVLLPPIRIRDHIEMKDNMLRIAILGKSCWEKTFASITDDTKGEIHTALGDILSQRLHQFVNRHMVKLRVDHLKSKLPFCVDGVIPERISLTMLKQILKQLVLEGRSISDLYTIIETVDEHLDTADIPTLVKIVGKKLEA